MSKKCKLEGVTECNQAILKLPINVYSSCEQINTYIFRNWTLGKLRFFFPSFKNFIFKVAAKTSLNASFLFV